MSLQASLRSREHLAGKVTEALTLRRETERQLQEVEAMASDLQVQQQDLSNMLEIARKAAGLVQDTLATKLSGIVTKALGSVFEEPIEFIARFVERRGVSECDLLVKVNGEEYDILREDGGGMADVCSLTLQMAFILMSPVDRILIADEIARHTDGESQDRFAAVIKELCQELNFTIITVTHSDAIAEVADKVFHINKKEGISYVRENN